MTTIHSSWENTVKKFILIVTILAILILSGCNLNTFQAFSKLKDGNTNTTIEGNILASECDPVCGENQECSDGICICTTGFIGCNNACIPEDGCCGDSDCEEGEGLICSENTCVINCEGIFCPLNQVCAEEGCACKEETTWCEAQQRCIENDKCCDGHSCSENRRKTICSKMTLSAEVCIVYEGTKSCKYVREQGKKNFYLDGLDLTISLDQVFEGNYFDFRVVIDDFEENLSKMELSKNGMDKTPLESGVALWVQSMSYQGGECVRPN